MKFSNQHYFYLAILAIALFLIYSGTKGRNRKRVPKTFEESKEDALAIIKDACLMKQINEEASYIDCLNEFVEAIQEEIEITQTSESE